MEKTLIPLDDYLEACAVAVEDAIKASLTGVLAAGKALEAARKRFPDDQGFGGWRQTRLPWLSSTMALHWRNTYSRFKDDPSVINGLLPGRALYILAAPSTEDEVVDAAVTLVQSGQKVDDDMVKRLKNDVENLKKDKESTIQKLIQERDREKQKRKQAEAVTKASDREKELARQKAEAEERAERLASELASAKAQIDGGLGVAELLEPKVVIQEDTESKRELERVRQQLEEKTRLHELAAKHAGQFQEEMHKATSRAAYLENKLKEVEDTSVVLGVFARQVQDWKAQIGFVATVIKDKEQTLDGATVETCREIADRLMRLADFSQDQGSLEAA